MLSVKIGEAIIHGDEYRSFSFVSGMTGSGTSYEISDDKKTLILRWQQTSWPKSTGKWNPHLVSKKKRAKTTK